jgi:hypothetical protein
MTPPLRLTPSMLTLRITMLRSIGVLSALPGGSVVQYKHEALKLGI